MRINLSEVKPSNYRIIIGILIVSLASFNFGYIISSQDIKTINLFISIIFLILGVVHIFEGFGKTIADLFGGKYIEITDGYVKLKTSLFAKEEVINWSDIKSIDVKILSIEITEEDGSKHKISLGNLDYETILKVKECFREKSNVLYQTRSI